MATKKAPAKKPPTKKPATATKKPASTASSATSTSADHERTATKSEAEIQAGNRRLVMAYLEQRDGMDPDVASMVIDGLSPEEMSDLIIEAQTFESKEPAKTAGAAATTDEEDDGEYEEYTAIGGLQSFTVAETAEGFADLVLAAVGASKAKNEAEKTYKATKKVVIGAMKGACVTRAAVSGIKLRVYTGHTYTLDEHMLLEAGVSADVIKRCWKDTSYDDVRITVPKAAKA